MSKFLDTAGLGALRDWVLQKVGLKQDTLVSGTNIKTINSQSLLGSGDIDITNGLQNLVDGITKGSVRGINTTTESSSYKMGNSSFAEGYNTIASGFCSHAEGSGTTASGSTSHTEGYYSTASSSYSHAEGSNTTASGIYSHAEGLGSIASGDSSHAQNKYTIATKNAQTAIGKYNIEDTETVEANQKAFIIGNGSADNIRSNAFTVDWQGNTEAAGIVKDNQGDLRNLQTSYLNSPNGSKWALQVDNNGNLSAILIN